MTTAAEIRSWLQRVLEETGWSVRQWAASAGVSSSTIYRALEDDYEFVTSTKTLTRLAQAAGVAPLDATSTVTQSAPRFLPVRYRVGAGIWREVGLGMDVIVGDFPVSESRAFSSFPQWLELVEGDSMNLEYPEGSLLHVVDAVEMGYAPRPGDHVILVRRRNEGQQVERTVKEVVRNGKRLEFWPRSTNPRWKAVVMDGDPQFTEIEVVGLVIGSYRPRRT